MPTVLVCALIGTAQMTWGVMVPVLPLYLERYGLAVGLIGPVVAAFAVGRVIANVPAGLALRRFPPRTYLRIVLVALAVVTALTGLATTAAALIGLRLVAGLLGGAAITVGFAVLVAGAPAGKRGSVMATATAVQMSAAAAGALLGGSVVGLVGPAWTFPIAALPVLLALLWDAVRPARMYWDTPVHRPAAARPKGPGRTFLLAALCAEAFATFFVRFAGEQGLVPVIAYETGGLTPFTLGLATAAGTLVSLAAMPLIGRWVDRGARIALLVPAGILAAGAFAALPLLRSPIAFGLAIVGYSVATSVIGVLPGVIAGEAYPPEAVGGVIGLTRTFGDIGAAVGPLAVFAVAGAAGYPAAGTVPAVLFLVTVVFLATALTSRGKEREGGHRHADLARS